MLVVDHENSEHGRQRRRATNGRPMHCCCICGKVDLWDDTWSGYYSLKELDDEVPVPKFCSEVCRQKGGPRAENVTSEMKRAAKDSEWREPRIAYREASQREAYREALDRQRLDREPRV